MGNVGGWRSKAAGFLGVGALVVVAVLVVFAAVGDGDRPQPIAAGQAPGQGSAPASDTAQRRLDDSMAGKGLTAGPMVRPTGTYRELRVAIRRGDGTGPPKAVPARAEELSVQVLERRSRTGALPVTRSFEPAPGEVLVVAVDRTGQVRWASSTPDPRIVRAEFPDAQGRLSGQAFERPLAELTVQIPDVPELTEVRIYRVRDGAGGPVVDLIGSVPVA